MLDPAHWHRLHGLTLSPRMLMGGVAAGKHAAARVGAGGGEFHDYRPYVPGDDITQLDWKAFGRSDRYYLRRHRHETDLTLHVLVDASASMDFAGLDARGRPVQGERTPTKRRYALDLAMALAFIAVRQGDRVGAGMYDARLRTYFPPGGTWPHLRRLRDTLAGLAVATTPPDAAAEPGGVADPAAALHALERHANGRGDRGLSGRGLGRSLVVMASDFLDEPGPFFAGVDRLRFAGAQIIAVTVLTPTELDPGHVVARLRLRDPEAARMVDADVSRVAERYRRRLGEHLEHFRRGCLARGIGHHLLRTDEAVPIALRRVLA